MQGWHTLVSDNAAEDPSAPGHSNAAGRREHDKEDTDEYTYWQDSD